MTAARPTSDDGSPSATSPLLPRLRTSRRGSLASTSSTHLANKEILAETLDHIHNAACQSDALTTFNEYTSPPSSSSGAEDKGITSDLQGGLSGLYSRFRASVGNVKDIVTLSAEDSNVDEGSTRSPRLALPSPTAGRSLADPTKSPNPSIHTVAEEKSHSGSRQSSRGATPGEAPIQDALRRLKPPRLASGNATGATKVNSGAAGPLRSPASLTAATASAATPAVVELNVNATKEPTLVKDAVHKGSPSQDVVSHVRPSSTSRAEAKLSSAASQQRPDNAQSRSAELGEDKSPYTVVLGPPKSISISGDMKANLGHLNGLNEIKDPKGLRSYEISMDAVSRPQSSSPNSPGLAEFQKMDYSIKTSSNTKEPPKIVTVPDTPQPTSMDSLIPSNSEKGLLSTSSAKSQHHEDMEAPVFRSTGSQPNSRPRTPDISLARTSSETTATTLVHASRHDEHIAKERPRDSKTMNVVLSQARSKILNREYWMRDENARDCFYCGDPFSTFRRKHHCRTCGQIFDAKCTTLLSGASFNHTGSIRVCKPCESIINGYDDSSDFSDESSVPTSGLRPRHGSTGASDALGSPLSRSSPLRDDIRRSPMQPDINAPTMAIPAARKAGGDLSGKPPVLEIGTERTLARPSSSRSLKSSYMGRPYIPGHRRHHSRHLTQRGFQPVNEDDAPFHQNTGGEKNKHLPAFHDDNIIDPDLAPYLSDEASSGDEQMSIVAALSGGTGMSKSLEHEKGGLAGFLSSSKKGRSKLGEKSITGITAASRDTDNVSLSSSRGTNILRNSRRRNLSVANNLILRPSPRGLRNPMSLQQTPLHLPETSETIEHGQSSLPQASTAAPRMMRSSSMRGAAAPAVELNNASLQHVRKLLRQLLQDAELQSVSSWEKALVPILLQATDDVNPDVQRGDDIDVRHYVKLKRIPGGRPGDTSYVSGLVFTKNVALKSMPRSIANPNILILTFALEYARHQQHFMSLEPVIRQEREYLQNLVSRIAALRPQLLLVQRNVSGLALDLLEQANIATAYNVKSSVLEAVSRCSQTRIISSIDKLAIKPIQAGTCSNFYLKTYIHKGRKKTYMFLSGCTKELGCTIVLRGADEGTLAKLKRITEFMVYVVYNLKLETCLMRDEFALIPSSVEIGSLTAGKILPRNASEAVKPDPNAPETISSTADQTLPTGRNGMVSASAASKEEVSSHQTKEQEAVAPADETNVPEDVPMPTFYTDMVEKHRTKILSASPFVKFMQPYLLMRAREQERRLAYLKRLRDQDCSEEQPESQEPVLQSFNLITPEMVHGSLQNASKKAREALHAVHDAEYDKALHNYQTQSRQWEAYLAGSINLFDPYAHQNIAVLYSMVCTVTTVPCFGPGLLALGFYNEHETDVAFEADCTLGQYIEELCFNAKNICLVNGCEKRLLDHHRQYVHGEAQLNVFVEAYPCRLRGLQDTILMWSICKICGKETQVLPMSEGTWKYSFGKYLELSFWSSDLHARAGICPHDLHRDHMRYFGFRDMAVRVHYDPITLLEIIVPRLRVTWKVDNDLRFKNDIFSKVEDRINRFMTSVKARIKSIKVESVIPEKAVDCRQEIERITKQAEDDHQALIRKLRDKYMNSKFYEIIPLNRAIRYTQEKVSEWDTAFADFDSNYFPSEKDIRRLATLQLKKIFLERDESDAPLLSSDGTATQISEVILEKVSKDAVPILTPQTRTMSPEKTHDMLAAVVEREGSSELSEKSSSDHHDSAPATAVPTSVPNVKDENASTSMNGLKRLKNEDVRHLDLAISSKLLETLDERQENPSDLEDEIRLSDNSATKISGNIAADDQTKILDIPQSADLMAKDDPKSKNFIISDSKQGTAIPRPTEGQSRRMTSRIPPPLLRAQSQPNHVKDKSSSSSQEVSSQSQSSASDTQSKQLREPNAPSATITTVPKPPEKKLSDRLGLGVLKPPNASSHSMIPRSIVSRRAQSNVSNLAKHFEQLSREFEKERLKDRRQRAASNRQSRAYPKAASRPIIEIYRNVHEAVEERDPSDEDMISSDPSPQEQEESPSVADHMAANMVSETQGQGFHAEDTTAETTETEDTNQLDSHTGSDTEGEGDRAENGEMLDGIQTSETAADQQVFTPTEAQLDLKLDLPKHEKMSLLKILTNFWAERSASGWEALEYPTNPTDHVFANSDIIVREDEPGSLIAYALESEEYKEYLQKVSESDHGLSSQNELVNSQESFLGSDEPIEVERSLNRSTGSHFRFQFPEGSAKLICKVFFVEQFDALRRKCGVSERIVESLSRSIKWDSKGGKTKSVFLKTLDDRFVLKSLSTIETQAFLRFAPAYFQIMSESLFHDLPSVIAKMLGFYQVIIKNPATGVEFNGFLLLLENLFYDRALSRIFDLKGSMRNRRIQSTGEKNEVLLDENMVDFIYESPLFAREHSKKLLRASLWNDTLFLAKQNVMDYSLMVAIDNDKKELVVGIIDCIRTYTWDKKLEFWIKDRGKNKPTVTSPRDYKNRFREAMERYVLQAPNCWHHFSTHQPPSTTAAMLGEQTDGREREEEMHGVS